MTREEILNMPAGKEMDALITEKIMGLVWDETRCRVCGWPLADDPKDGCILSDCSMRPLPKTRADEPAIYSTDLGAAWKLNDHLKQQGWRFYMRDFDGVMYGKSCAAEFQKGDAAGPSTGWVEAETAPLAICRAALLAVMDGEK